MTTPTTESWRNPITEMTVTGIPRSLTPYFQEYNLDTLDPDLYWEMVVERTLGYGTRREIRWLFQRYGPAAITDWLQRMGARRLPWRRHNLWCVLLGLPVGPHPARQGKRIWPY